MRAALRVAAVLVLFALAAPSASAADPTLGARLSPIEIVYQPGATIEVTNLSTVPVTVILSADNGWSLGVASLALAPKETGSVPITMAGDGPAIIRATLTPTTAIAGTDSNALVLETHARRAGFWDALTSPKPALWPLVLLLPFVASGWLLRRLRRS